MIRKVKETGEVDEDGNPIQLSDVEKEGDGGVGDEGTVEGRIQSPKQEVKEELKEISTPKRKRATKPKGKPETPKAEPVVPEVADIKPDVGEDAISQAQPEVKGKAPPKKRAKKSQDTAEA
jgi:UV DNA damage endonuclease